MKMNKQGIGKDALTNSSVGLPHSNSGLGYQTMKIERPEDTGGGEDEAFLHGKWDMEEIMECQDPETGISPYACVCSEQ